MCNNVAEAIDAEGYFTSQTAGTATRRQRRAKRRKQTWRRPVRTSLYLAIVLLLLSGDIHPNPGPPKHPCGTCDTSVRSNRRRVVCDTCDTWSHIKCVGIDRATYERLSVADKMWICIKRSLPFTYDRVIKRQHLLQLNSSDILLSSRDTSCPTIGINTNSSNVPDITTSTTSTSSTTTPSQIGLFDNAKLHKGMKIAHLNLYMWLGV